MYVFIGYIVCRNDLATWTPLVVSLWVVTKVVPHACLVSWHVGQWKASMSSCDKPFQPRQACAVPYEAPTHLIGCHSFVQHVWDIDTLSRCFNTYETHHVACPFNYIKPYHLDMYGTCWGHCGIHMGHVCLEFLQFFLNYFYDYWYFMYFLVLFGCWDIVLKLFLVPCGLSFWRIVY